MTRGGTDGIEVREARRLLSLIDHTALDDGRSAAEAERVCREAVAASDRLREIGPVAAVCLWPDFVAPARAWLAGSGVRLATVVNFPEGTATAETVADETRRAVADGAEEIDVVMPYGAWRAGDRAAAGPVIAAARATCGGRVLLKVILETGQLGGAEAVRAAGRAALRHGADFLKTSTGKLQPGAEPEAVRALAEVVAEHRAAGGRIVGIKVSGGVRTIAAAAGHLSQIEGVVGEGWATAQTLRFGASALLGAVVAACLHGAPSTEGKPRGNANPQY